MATYYVDPSCVSTSTYNAATQESTGGTDTNYNSLSAALGGSAAQPAGTIIEARAATPGATVTFNETLTWSANAVGSSAASLVILRCRPGDTCIIDGGNTRQFGIALNSRNFVKISGFTIQNQGTANAAAVSVTGSSSGYVIDNCKLDGKGVSSFGIIDSSTTSGDATITNITAQNYTTGFGHALRFTSKATASTITINNIVSGGSDITKNNNILYISGINGPVFHISNLTSSYDTGGPGFAYGDVYMVNSIFGAGSYLNDSNISYCQAGDNVNIGYGVSGLTINRLISHHAYRNGSPTNIGSGLVILSSTSGSTHDIAVNDSELYANGNDGVQVMHTQGAVNPPYNITFNRVWSHDNGTASDANAGDGFTAHRDGYNIYLNYCKVTDNFLSGVGFVDRTSGYIRNLTAVTNGVTSHTRANLYFGTTAANPTTSTGWTVQNVISTGGMPYEVYLSTAASTTTIFSYNDYLSNVSAANFALINATPTSWAIWNGTYDLHSILIDPLLSPTYHPLPGSPCIGAGTNTPITGTASATDPDGRPITDSAGTVYTRFIAGVQKDSVDIGAYQYPSDSVSISTDGAATGGYFNVGNPYTASLPDTPAGCSVALDAGVVALTAPVKRQRIKIRVTDGTGQTFDKTLAVGSSGGNRSGFGF